MILIKTNGILFAPTSLHQNIINMNNSIFTLIKSIKNLNNNNNNNNNNNINNNNNNNNILHLTLNLIIIILTFLDPQYEQM